VPRSRPASSTSTAAAPSSCELVEQGPVAVELSGNALGPPCKLQQLAGFASLWDQAHQSLSDFCPLAAPGRRILPDGSETSGLDRRPNLNGRIPFNGSQPVPRGSDFLEGETL